MIYWMYHDEIYIANRIYNDEDDHGGEEGVMNTAQGLFAKLFVLGEKYHIPKLQNDAIDAMLDWPHDYLDLRVVPYIYTNTLYDLSPFRCLLVRLASWETEFSEFHTANCQKFWLDVIDVFAVKRGSPYINSKEIDLVLQNPKNDFCQEFHTHDEANSGKCKKLKKPWIEEESEEEHPAS